MPALVGAAWSAVTLAVVAAPGYVWLSPWLAVIPVVALTLPSFVAAGLRADRLIRSRSPLRLSPGPACLGLAGLGFAVVTLIGLTQLPVGNPLEADGKYFFNDRGTLHEVARYQYDHAILVEDVVALGALGVICMASAFILFAQTHRRQADGDVRGPAGSP